jgi:hypothetical protein
MTPFGKSKSGKSQLSRRQPSKSLTPGYKGLEPLAGVLTIKQNDLNAISHCEATLIQVIDARR